MNVPKNLPNVFEKDTPLSTYAAGSVIYKEGEPRDSMYIVKKGEVDLLVRGQLVETVPQDGFFGEIAFVDRSPRSATAVAKTDCSLIAINEKQFLFNVQEVPFFALIVMRTLTGRLRKRTMVFSQNLVERPSDQSTMRGAGHKRVAAPLAALEARVTALEAKQEASSGGG